LPDTTVRLGNFDPERLAEDFPGFIPVAEERNGATCYRLRLPSFPQGREFEAAELVLPRGFPDQFAARIRLSSDAVLRLPHVEKDGFLCIDGDPGPSSGASADDRIYWLLDAFEKKFLRPWLLGELDDDFAKEALDYWRIYVDQHAHPEDAINSVWIAEPPCEARVVDCALFTPAGIIAVHAEHRVLGRIRHSLGATAKQELRAVVADIPIDNALTPQTWPQSMDDLRFILNGRLPEPDCKKMLEPRRRNGRTHHRVVLLRNPAFGFAYLLPGGPTIQAGGKKKQRARLPSKSPRPLNVSRIDASWIVGRDQHPVGLRQSVRVLVLGAGALGSPVVDQLAKAGIGHIDLVDPQNMVAENVGRHLLGAESIQSSKAISIAQRIETGQPHTSITPSVQPAEVWLREQGLGGVDAVLDLTGEPDVRWAVEKARKEIPCALLIGWLEPYVAAAHACVLPAGVEWMRDGDDPMVHLEAVEWPSDVMQQQPGCSSRFQSYTAAAAAHAVALVAEQALALIDGEIQEARIVSWIRGKRFLSAHRDDLILREWAHPAAEYDGLVLERPFK